MPPYKHPNAKPKPWTRPFSSSSTNTKPATTKPTSTTSLDKPRSRLKPAPIQQDGLEAAGLPSKGDTTLLDFRAQEAYYTLLTSRYMDWCASTGTTGTTGVNEPASSRKAKPTPDNNAENENDLSQSFSGMSLDGSSFHAGTTSASTSSPSSSAANRTSSDSSTGELATLLLSMRKLREAILSTGRVDPFAQAVYIFIARAGILSRTFESYHPALLHLLYGMHARAALSSSTLHELLVYHVLDSACRLHDLSQAIALCHQWKFMDVLVDAVLRALVRNDWPAFWRAAAGADGYQRALLAFVEDDVRTHALKCLGRAYLSVGRTFVERAAGGRPWAEIVRRNGVGWEVDGEVVVVRRVKSAPKKAAVG